MHGSPASHRCMGTVQVILVGALLGAALRAILCSAIEHRDAAWCGHLRALPSAPAELPEGRSESLRHQAVDDGVDGTVQVDAHPAEEEEPNVEVRGGPQRTSPPPVCGMAATEGRRGPPRQPASWSPGEWGDGEEKAPGEAKAPAEPSHLEELQTGNS